MDDDDLRAQFGGLADFFRPGVLIGTDEEVLDTIGRYVAAGADQVNVALRPPWHPEALERLAQTLKLEVT